MLILAKSEPDDRPIVFSEHHDSPVSVLYRKIKSLLSRFTAGQEGKKP